MWKPLLVRCHGAAGAQTARAASAAHDRGKARGGIDLPSPRHFWLC
jgi:hypothetical protein